MVYTNFQALLTLKLERCKMYKNIRIYFLRIGIQSISVHVLTIK